MSFADQKAKAQADATQLAADLAKVQADEAVVVADLTALAQDPPPVVVVSPPVTPDGLYTTAVIDKNGVTWSIVGTPGTSGAQIAKNGVIIPPTNSVKTLFIKAGIAYFENTSGTWYTPDPAGVSNSTQVSDPTVGFVVTPPSGSLIKPSPLAVVRFQSDFTSSFPEGGFSNSALAKQFLAYSGFADTSGSNGWYDTQGISVHDGLLDLHFVPDSQGRLRAICMIPDLAKQGSWNTVGFTYGQTDTVLNVPTADATAGSIHPALMLWPTNNNWPEGEADGLETNLNGHYAGFLHALGANPATNIASGDSGINIADGKDHLWTQLWTPQGYWSSLDGKPFITYPFPWATTEHRLTEQWESNGKPPADLDVHVFIKSVTVSQSA